MSVTSKLAAAINNAEINGKPEVAAALKLFRDDVAEMESAIAAVREQCDHYADGTPDATQRDMFAHLILGIIERNGR